MILDVVCITRENSKNDVENQGKQGIDTLLRKCYYHYAYLNIAALLIHNKSGINYDSQNWLNLPHGKSS